MKAEQRAVIERAKKEGLAPSEIASELLVHDMLTSALNVIRGHAVAFKNMSEQQQDAAIKSMQDEFTKAARTAVRIIAGAGTQTVRMQLKKVAIGTKYQIQGIAEGTEEHLHALCDKAQDQSDVLIVLYETDYEQGLDAIQAEKDQKDLPLDGKEPADKKPRAAAKKDPKPIELPAGLVDQAREFVLKFQNGTVAGLQNHLKIGTDKALALHEKLVTEGLLSAEQNERGDRELVRKAVDTPDVDEESTAKVGVEPGLYEKAKTLVITERRISTTFLRGELQTDEDTTQAIIDALQADGVISEENEMGARSILIEA